MEDKKFIDVKDDDCIFYIYPNQAGNYRDDCLVLKDVNESLEKIRNEIQLLSEDYIWHNKGPKLTVGQWLGDGPLCFHGMLNYGENVEDEWFLFYILRTISITFPDIVIRIFDSDGEFLLIEAADYLPAWVAPENSEGRVFLFRGHIHILPKDYNPVSDHTDCETPSVSESILSFIRGQPEKSICSPEVEAAIQKRIADYPSKIRNLMHSTVVYVPVAVAALLDANPALVTSAVRAFCDRDLVDVRACKAMKYFPPENRVYAEVKFTKCSYAMLASSKYIPDKKIGWNLVAPTDASYKTQLLGIKLACGFEILLVQSKRRKNEGNNIEEHAEFQKFINRLTQLDYFRGLLQHSKEYNSLLNAAKEFYSKNINDHSGQYEHSDGVEIGKLLDGLEYDGEKLAQRGQKLGVVAADDSWMNVTREELDAMLSARFGVNPDSVDATSDKPQEIAQHLTKFITQVSGVEGVQLPTAAVGQPARPERRKKIKSVKFTPDTKMHSVTSSEQIAAQPHPEPSVSIEPDGFVKALQNILDFSIPDDNYWESDGSGMSSYEDEDEIDLKPNDKQGVMSSYYNQMDNELSSTSMAKSFVKKKKDSKPDGSSGAVEDLEPVDIDMNALQNIIMSYQSQMGLPGPAENILGPMGVNLADIDADVD